MTAAQDRADRLDWEAWVLAEQGKLQGDASTPAIEEWDGRRIAAYRVAGRKVPDFVSNPQGAYAGAWHIVRNWCSPEFVEHVERFGNPRITWAEWRERAAAQREQDERAEADYRDDVARPLESLAYWRQLNDERGTMILQARERGASWAEICRASGLSRQQANVLANNAGNAARREAYWGEPF